MKITAARVIVCSPGRNFVTLKIETDSGLTGLGDATLGLDDVGRHLQPDGARRDAKRVRHVEPAQQRQRNWMSALRCHELKAGPLPIDVHFTRGDVWACLAIPRCLRPAAAPPGAGAGCGSGVAAREPAPSPCVNWY